MVVSPLTSTGTIMNTLTITIQAFFGCITNYNVSYYLFAVQELFSFQLYLLLDANEIAMIETENADSNYNNLLLY
jgi:hypothetical protein